MGSISTLIYTSELILCFTISVKYSLGAVGFSYLLYSVLHCNRAIWKWNKLRRFESYGDCTLPKLVPKPDPVFLKDPRSKKGSQERHDQTVLLFLRH